MVDMGKRKISLGENHSGPNKIIVCKVDGSFFLNYILIQNRSRDHWNKKKFQQNSPCVQPVKNIYSYLRFAFCSNCI